MSKFRAAAAAVLLCGCASEPPPPALPPPPPITLEQAIAGAHRSEARRSRDVYRHPLETLEFFGIEDHMTVVEVWPGAGWYTEILAPYLRARGRYVAAVPPPVTPAQQKALADFRAQLAARPELYDRVLIGELGPPDRWLPVPPGSADLVLTFRNVHNWLASGHEREMFAAFYRSLRPRGVLGVVEHRGAEGMRREDMVRSGYVPQDYVIQLATDAGFVHLAWDEINANPRDTKDHPAGVWTLPPTLRLGDQDRDKYLAIGESDRMTLKFVKP